MAASVPQNLRPELVIPGENENNKNIAKKIQYNTKNQNLRAIGSYFPALNRGYGARFPFVENRHPKVGELVFIRTKKIAEIVKFLGEGIHGGLAVWKFETQDRKQFIQYLKDRCLTWMTYTENRFDKLPPEGYRPVFKGDVIPAGGLQGLFVSTNNAEELAPATLINRDESDHTIRLDAGNGGGVRPYLVDTLEKGVLWEFFIVNPQYQALAAASAAVPAFAANAGAPGMLANVVAGNAANAPGLHALANLAAEAEEEGENKSPVNLANLLAVEEEGWGGEGAELPNIALPLPAAAVENARLAGAKRKANRPAPGNENNENKRARPPSTGGRRTKRRERQRNRKGTRKGNRKGTRKGTRRQHQYSRSTRKY
jgi:hypothetical protein